MARTRFRMSRARAFFRWHFVSTHTTTGKLADIALIIIIIIGVLALILDSVPSITAHYHQHLIVTEAFVGTIFVLEYGIRVWVARLRLRWMLSFWGIIDLLAILPFLFQGFGMAYLRVFRVLRVFSILKIGQYTSASRLLADSLVASRSKIGVFLLTVVVLVLVLGFTMHAIEPQTFPTVPDAIWWVVVTVTTVGYGDLVPVTLLGRLIAGAAMIAAFGIIAVPTGIVAAEVASRRPENAPPGIHVCHGCGHGFHVEGARFCALCGCELED
jgi:voltage-gated potassium channel